MLAEESALYQNQWRTYWERNAQLVKNCGQAYNLILGQCIQLLWDQFEQDPNWEKVKRQENPLLLYHLIEKMILVQTKDKYPFKTT
jgi:hypothetical protein